MSPEHYWLLAFLIFLYLCVIGELDLALVITGTQSRQQKLYRSQIKYINQLVTRFNLLNGFTRLAAVTNGNTARVMFNFKDGGVSTKKIQTLMTDLQNPGQSLNVKKATSILLDDVFTASNSARRMKIQRSVIFFITLNDNDLAKVKENVQKIKDDGIDVTVVVIGDEDKQRMGSVKNALFPVVGDAKKIIFLESDENTDLVAEKVDDTVKLISSTGRFHCFYIINLHIQISHITYLFVIFLTMRRAGNEPLTSST